MRRSVARGRLTRLGGLASPTDWSLVRCRGLRDLQAEGG